jgi:thiamine-monophosphate kinase
VTILGEVPSGKALRRSGAQPRDGVYVSGRLGDAALAVAHHRGRIALDRDELKQCDAAMLRPTPRIALGERLRGIASAAIDLSDGLTGDLGHILDASGVGARLEFAAIPRSEAIAHRVAGAERALALECLLTGGDDYELCFTAPEARAAEIDALAKALALPLTRIGSIEKKSGLTVLDEQGRALPALPHAFDHFAS